MIIRVNPKSVVNFYSKMIKLNKTGPKHMQWIGSLAQRAWGGAINNMSPQTLKGLLDQYLLESKQNNNQTVDTQQLPNALDDFKSSLQKQRDIQIKAGTYIPDEPIKVTNGLGRDESSYVDNNYNGMGNQDTLDYISKKIKNNGIQYYE